MDKIFIKNLRVSGILGIHQHEQETPQPIMINAAVLADITKAAKNDNIHQTINYATMAREIIKLVKSSHFFTVEALISAIADMILQDKRIGEVWLRVEKPNAVADTDSVGVEITRLRGD
ncbi:MAG: dihydroneopterin aldolase [Chloroflexota bacterium]|nr:dihydroneopterin aldolase [Chloroflexota bacterium]